MNKGDVIQDKYVIDSEIGKGSFGTVYLARQTNIDRPVALKILLPWVNADEGMRHRFKREAKTASVLRSPHSIDIFDFGETNEDCLFLVMEFLEGAPLDQVLKEQGALDPARVTSITRQVLEALTEAHQKGIIHRDLKPDNIYLCIGESQQDFVKVFDFGIAKLIGNDQEGHLRETTKLTVTGGTVGTPVYMSPEQCRGQDLSPASDLYSLGIVLYECLTGTVPFEDSNPVQTMMMHNSMPVPQLPENLCELAIGKAVMQVLNKKPDERFASAEEFAHFLSAVDSGAGEGATVSAPLPPPVPVEKRGTLVAMLAAAKRTSYLTLLLLVVAVILLTVVVTFVFLQSAHTP